MELLPSDVVHLSAVQSSCGAQHHHAVDDSKNSDKWKNLFEGWWLDVCRVFMFVAKGRASLDNVDTANSFPLQQKFGQMEEPV